MDAELLGQVYLVLKQQQGILEIDAAPVSADVHDISDVELPVIRATEEDLSENERVLEMVRKAAKGPALYDLDEETFNAKRKEEQDALDAKEAKLQDLLYLPSGSNTIDFGSRNTRTVRNSFFPFRSISEIVPAN